MLYIGGDNEIKAPFLRALLDRILTDVQGSVLHVLATLDLSLAGTKNPAERSLKVYVEYIRSPEGLLRPLRMMDVVAPVPAPIPRTFIFGFECRNK